MDRNGSTIKPDSLIALRLDTAVFFKNERDSSHLHKNYVAALENANEILSQALKTAAQNPEDGLAVARQCMRFILEALPDPEHDFGRAMNLSLFETLENMLVAVRKPSEYLTRMQRQFGSKLDPRNYKAGDAFISIINSQRQRLYRDGQSSIFASPEEKLFCSRQRELLKLVEKAYNLLRDQALGRVPQGK